MDSKSREFIIQIELSFNLKIHCKRDRPRKSHLEKYQRIPLTLIDSEIDSKALDT